MRETIYWLLNVVAALIIFVLLGLHMGLMHLDGVLAAVAGVRPDPLAWDNLLVRGRSGFFTATYVLLLAAALFHGFYGLRTMLIEFWSGQRARRLTTVACWLIGLALFAVGAYVTIAFPGIAGGRG